MTILELACQAGLTPKRVASTRGGEYHSSCPKCGGADRFYIQPNRQMSNCIGYYACRQCGIYGDSIQFACEFLQHSFAQAVQSVNATISTEQRRTITIPQKSNSRCCVTLQKPSVLWINAALHFSEQCHKQLLRKHDILKFLFSRGLPLDAVKQYKLGWSGINEFVTRASWGLDEQIASDGKKRALWIPKGLVIPTIESNDSVVRLKVRRFDWKIDDTLPKYVAISGSMNGLNIIGNTNHAAMIVVESELDAYAIHHAINDFAYVVAVGSNIKNPDNVTDYYAQKVHHLFICHDNDEAGNKMLIKWQQLYAHAKSYPTPYGKDIGEAVQQGLNLRSWVLSLLGK